MTDDIRRVYAEFASIQGRTNGFIDYDSTGAIGIYCLDDSEVIIEEICRRTCLAKADRLPVEPEARAQPP